MAADTESRPDDSKMPANLKDWAAVIRDFGVILGVPTIIAVGMGLYDLQDKALEAQVKANEAQIKVLEAQNSALKETQFDRAVALIEAQKKAYELDKANTASEFNKLRQQLSESETNNAAKLTQVLKSERECLNKVVATIGAKIIMPSAEGTTTDASKVNMILQQLTDFADKICD